MNSRPSLLVLAFTLGLAFVGAAAGTEHSSKATLSAQQTAFLPVPLCPPDAPVCKPGNPPEQTPTQGLGQ